MMGYGTYTGLETVETIHVRWDADTSSYVGAEADKGAFHGQ